MSERPANDFRERARVEADRYGPDPWIFVRELLQNARDAGARTVSFVIDEGPSGTRVRCRDDGEGMSYEHARRYLFSLYASSKEDRANQVGRFGVGFWSILRFDPVRIVIRSRPRPQPGKPAEPGWQVVLDGALAQGQRSLVEMEPGTEVWLERGPGDGSDGRRVWEAAHQNARFLCLRDEPDVPLPVLVDGRAINAAFALPAPSAAFRRGQVRGVVGLGSAPRVELFSRGLRVRSAACLDDLLSSSGHTGHSRVRFPELPGGLAPQALLESEGLELLLSRSDARDTRTLRRLVKLGQAELRRLVERQLARIRPPGLGERLAGLVRRLVGESTWWRAVLGAVTGAVLAYVIARLLWSTPTELVVERPVESSGVARAPTVRSSYSALAARYDGPQVSELDASGEEPLALRYSPAQARPYFAALIIREVGGSASAPSQPDSPAYPSWACEHDCLSIELPIADGPGPLPIPTPSGHRIEPESVRVLDASSRLREFPLVRDAAGQPVLWLDRRIEGVLRYRSGPGPALDQIPLEHGEVLTGSLRRDARELRSRPVSERVDAAIDLVRKRVKYSTKREIAEKHDAAKRAGKPFVGRALEIGAGDCDVQNGLLVAVLREAKLDARLAVGWVGDRGSVSPWLHAWVEWRAGEGPWQIADATGRELDAGQSVAGLPPSPREVAIGTPTALLPSEPDPTPSEPSPSGSSESPSPSATPSPSPVPPSELGRSDELLAWASSQRWLPWTALGLGVLGLSLLGGSLLGRTARTVQLDEGGDLSSLLQGALAQPGAFRHLPSLFHRRLIPVRGGSAVSLNHARTLASRGSLYVGAEQTELSRTARRRGITMLDADTPEGRTVAAALAATDLDRWGHRMARGQDTPLLQAIAQHLHEHGERWRITMVKGLGDPVATLDLRPLGARSRLGDRLVLIDAADPFLLETEQLRASRPHTAAFTLLDHLLDHLDLGAKRRAALLAPLAARALQEAGR